MEDLREILRDLKKFIFIRGKFWILPILVLFAILGIMTLLSHPLAVAPLVYSIF